MFCCLVCAVLFDMVSFQIYMFINKELFILRISFSVVVVSLKKEQIVRNMLFIHSIEVYLVIYSILLFMLSIEANKNKNEQLAYNNNIYIYIYKIYIQFNNNIIILKEKDR